MGLGYHNGLWLGLALWDRLKGLRLGLGFSVTGSFGIQYAWTAL